MLGRPFAAPSARPTIAVDRGPRARLHRRDRHPVPEQPVRRRRLPRRHGRDGDRVGDDPAAVRADPAVRRVPRVRPEPDRAAHRPAVELLDRGDLRDDRQHAGLAHRLRDRRVRRPAVPRALRQVPADPAARDRGSPTVLRRSTAPRRSSSAACCRSSGRSSASRPASPGCRSSTFIVYSTAGAFLWSCLLVYAGTVLGDELGRRSATRSSRSTWRSRSASCCRSSAVHLVAARDAGQARPATEAAPTRASRRPPSARAAVSSPRCSSGGRTRRKSRYISRS